MSLLDTLRPATPPTPTNARLVELEGHVYAVERIAKSKASQRRTWSKGRVGKRGKRG
jgi:hypothetical protein